VSVELFAGFGDHRQVPLQGTRLGLGDDEGGVREARLRHVRTEQPLGDDLRLYSQRLPGPDLVRHRVAAVKRVQAARYAVREPDETFATEPEL
jgi:hypothetical protein